jgi:hypothetical protein
VPKSTPALRTLVKQVLLADWGRRPYKEYWYQDQQVDERGPSVPKETEIRRQLRIAAIRPFRRSASRLKVPHWPALAFPTRPLRIDEIGLVAPNVLFAPRLFRSAIRFLRGAEVASKKTVGFEGGDDFSAVTRFAAMGIRKKHVRVAVTSVETTDKQWSSAAKGQQDRSSDRYVTFNNLINNILKEPERPDYIVMPELSVPLRWALRAARKLSSNGVSLLAGVEYHADRLTREIRNDCLVSLTTKWPGYASNVVVLQSKFSPAHGEREELRKILGSKNRFFRPDGAMAKPIIYSHGGFIFAALICSDLTNITHRNALRGEVDAVFVIEWNQDTKTFSSLVEASAIDLHAYVIQANNRRFGDSRIRVPADKDFERDVVQIKGGLSDYYVLGEVDFWRLRTEQCQRIKKPKFKPVPIGYVVSDRRKVR